MGSSLDAPASVRGLSASNGRHRLVTLQQRFYFGEYQGQFLSKVTIFLDHKSLLKSLDTTTE